jgi:hypothetical protein
MLTLALLGTGVFLGLLLMARIAAKLVATVWR